MQAHGSALAADNIRAGNGGHGGHDAHGAHAHDPHHQHHFDTPTQQFVSSKLGMWLFLVTEVLFFGGLFCFYAVYRYTHPEVFDIAHKYLDKVMGAINTCVLIFSSLTMAWAVRCAQLGQKKGLIVSLVLTMACAWGFMVVKTFEYHHKYMIGTLPASAFRPTELPPDDHGAAAHDAGHAAAPAAAHAHHDKLATITLFGIKLVNAKPLLSVCLGTLALVIILHGAVIIWGRQMLAAVKSLAPGARAGAIVGSLVVAIILVKSLSGSFETPGHPEAKAEAAHAEAKAGEHAAADPVDMPDFTRNVGVFFSIYFCMTGLHGIHVLIGIGLIGWLVQRAMNDEFGPKYFTPVDLIGLYWHIVDLIWIYLFPLLYLIK